MIGCANNDQGLMVLGDSVRGVNETPSSTDRYIVAVLASAKYTYK